MLTDSIKFADVIRFVDIPDGGLAARFLRWYLPHARVRVETRIGRRGGSYEVRVRRNLLARCAGAAVLFARALSWESR